MFAVFFGVDGRVDQSQNLLGGPGGLLFQGGRLRRGLRGLVLPLEGDLEQEFC